MPTNPPASYSVLANQPGTTLKQLFDTLAAYNEPEDTAEGGGMAKLSEYHNFWSARVSKNDSSGHNMFEQYHKALRAAVLTGMTAPCAGGAYYQGEWECMGPDDMPQQAVGYVTDVWADPADSNYILAASKGGLFKTTNGGANWECITDNAPLVGGVWDVTHIEVNPLNKSTIFLGTAGAGILKSFDNGATWQQEFMDHGLYEDSISSIQGIFFSPDTTRVYAIRNFGYPIRDSVYTRSNVGSGIVWQNITPPCSCDDWFELKFRPGNQNHIFVCNRAPAPGGSNIWQSVVPVPSASDWTNITAGLTASFGGTSYTTWDLFSMSIPHPDTLFFFASTDRHANIYKHHIPSGARSLVSADVPNDGAQDGKGVFVVSKSGTSNNGGRRNIYYGWDLPYHSYDGGISFHKIGSYDGVPTHGDIRAIWIQQDSNSLRGIYDRLFLATDGGVSKKPAGIDDSTYAFPELVTIDISGKGLTCGTFYGFSTSPKTGKAIGGMMHDGIVAYEPDQTPKWKNLLVKDAWTCAFDRTKKDTAYAFKGFNERNLVRTQAGGGRAMDAIDDGFPDPPGGFLVGPLTETDIAGNIFSCNKKFWLKTPSSPSFSDRTIAAPISWGFPDSLFAASIAHNPYASTFEGYVLWNERKDIYYRHPSLNAGIAFTITPVPGATEYKPVYLATDWRNTDRVWVARGSVVFDTGIAVTRLRVMHSPDHGTNWVDISKGLPQRIPVVRIVYDEATDMLYAGTDAGIYCCDFSTYNPSGPFTDGVNTSVEWRCFSKGKVAGHDFPNVAIERLEINHCDGRLWASTNGRSVWSTPLRAPLKPTHVITSTSTWSTERYITGNILVTSGGILTISGTTVYMPKDGKIIVQPGGKLVIDHSRITKFCEDCLWKGIEAWGDKYSSQTAANQGWVVIKNGSVIEHAQVGVCNYQTGILIDNDGGVIQVTGSTFLNNEKAAVFEPYLNFNAAGNMPDLSYFMNTTFMVDNNYRGTMTPANAQVLMTETDGVRFNGCSFINRKYSSSDGIRATNSGFQLGAYCTTPITTYATPCASLQRSIFKGFKNGIMVKHLPPSLDPTVTIDQADFDSVTVGVNINAYSNVSTTHCGFRVGRGYTLPEKVVDVPYACGSNIGILAQNCFQFTIEDNAFMGESNSFGISPWYNHGTIVSNCYSTPNKVYRNTYDSLDYAVLSSGDNHTNHYPAPPGNGLRVLCNAFAHNGTDIFVGGVLGGNGIANDQGDNMYSAGNTFNGSTTNIVNDNTYHTLRYYYNPGAGNEFPANVSNPSYVLRYGAYLSNLCPVTIPGKDDIRRTTAFGKAINTSDLNDRKRNFFGARAIYTDSLAAYNSLLDYGNTESLVGSIRGAASFTGVASTLNACSPNLSGRALMEVAMKFGDDTAVRSHIKTLFMNNPDALGSEGVLAYVKEVCGFGSNDMDSLINVASKDTTARRTGLQRSITQAEEAMHHEANLILMALKSPRDNSVSVSDSSGAGICFDSTNIYYLCDSTANYGGFDSVNVWLENIGGLWTEYARANTLRYFHNNSAAATLFEAIGHHLLSADDSAMYNTYDSLWSVMRSAEGDGRNMYNLTEEEVAMLDTGIDGNFSYNAARVIITGIKVNPTAFPCTVPIRTPRVPKGGATSDETWGAIPSTANISFGDRFSVYPNPTSGVVTFSYNLPDANSDMIVTVTNVVGEKIMEKKASDNAGKLYWDPAGLPAGVYMYRASYHKGIVRQGKIVVVK